MMFGTNKSESWRWIPGGSIGVEIGVWRGDMSEKFLRNAAWLHLVDPWAVTAYQDSDEFGDYGTYLKRYEALVGSADPAEFQRYYDRVYAGVVERFCDAPVTIHRVTSEQFWQTFTTPVDWVYVDGSHAYAGCLADLYGAMHLARHFIAGDDYGNKPGVTKAVDEFIRDTGLKLELDGNQYRVGLC